MLFQSFHGRDRCEFPFVAARMNRYAELTSAAKTIIDELINAVAAHPGWQESLAFDALKATRKAARKIVEVTS